MGAAQTDRSATHNVEEPRIDTAEVEEAFYFPFLGKVRSQMTLQEVKTHHEDDSTLAIPFRVYSDDGGTFRRAEFAQEGTSEFEWSFSIPTAIEAIRRESAWPAALNSPPFLAVDRCKRCSKVPCIRQRMNVTYSISVLDVTLRFCR